MENFYYYEFWKNSTFDLRNMMLKFKNSIFIWTEIIQKIPHCVLKVSFLYFRNIYIIKIKKIKQYLKKMMHLTFKTYYTPTKISIGKYLPLDCVQCYS